LSDRTEVIISIKLENQLKMIHRRIFIGDVHGHYKALMRLLEAIDPSSDDQIYFVGDLIDRGPQSAQVVEYVMENNHQCLRGNHEEMLINALGDGELNEELYKYWLNVGGSSTVSSYRHQIPQEHIEWLKQLPTFLDLEDIWLVHAGIHPNIPLEKQTSEEFCWIRDEFHSISEPYFADKLIITGHTITFTLPGVQPGRLAAGPGWLDIDTGAYHPHSGWLTALDWTNQMVYQINSQFLRLRKLPLKQATSSVDYKRVMAKYLRRTS
jgi:serine/threonine protein phosphatase 1